MAEKVEKKVLCLGAEKSCPCNNTDKDLLGCRDTMDTRKLHIIFENRGAYHLLFQCYFSHIVMVPTCSRYHGYGAALPEYYTAGILIYIASHTVTSYSQQQVN